MKLMKTRLGPETRYVGILVSGWGHKMFSWKIGGHKNYQEIIEWTQIFHSYTCFNENGLSFNTGRGGGCHKLDRLFSEIYSAAPIPKKTGGAATEVELI